MKKDLGKFSKKISRIIGSTRGSFGGPQETEIGIKARELSLLCQLKISNHTLIVVDKRLSEKAGRSAWDLIKIQLKQSIQCM